MASIPIVFKLLRPRPNTAARFSRIVALACMLLACVAAPAMADEPAGTTPLTPLDTSSPRATLRSFCDTVDRIFVNLTTAERTLALRTETRHLIQQAVTCLDISAIAPTLVDSESRQSIVCLKEVLDRIELPRAADIPDAAAAKADGLKRWRLPGTEIMLTRISDGPREGDFVFSAETVTQAARFYDLIRLLPYRSDAGSPGLHEAYVTIGGWMIPETFIRGLPAWAHAKILGETLWQWTATLLLLIASTAAVWHAWNIPRQHTGSTSRDVVGRLLFPAVLIAVSLICDNLLTIQIRLTGDNLLTAKIALRIRLGGKVLTFIIVSWILLNAADSIGIPVTPLMAGLGAGGLALALASQYTLENLIAGLVIFADKPVRIGDDCQFGGVRGRVERIGLRSTRIRGADRSVISVPNAEFAKMQLVNFTARDHIPLAITLTLQPDIAPRPLRKLLERLHRVLIDHPRLANDPASARLSSATPSAITVEVSAIALTGDDDESLAIREEVLLTMMEVIRSCGCDTSAEPTASPAIMRAAA